MEYRWPAQLKIPDLWYDVYARLLPGTAAVGAAYYLFSGQPKVPDGIRIVIGLMCGYFVGLVAQPVSSEITRVVHQLVATMRGQDRFYVPRIQKLLDERQASILDKMHGETTFFVQCAVLGIVLLVVQLAYPTKELSSKILFLHECICLYFLAAAVEVADRRLRRARDYRKIHGKFKVKPGPGQKADDIHESNSG